MQIGVFTSNWSKIVTCKSTKASTRERVEGRRDGADSSGKHHSWRDIDLLRRRRPARRGFPPLPRRRQEGHHLRRPRRLHPHLQVKSPQSSLSIFYFNFFLVGGFLLLCSIFCFFERFGFGYPIIWWWCGLIVEKIDLWWTDRELLTVFVLVFFSFSI